MNLSKAFKVNLPQIYSKEIWERCKNKHNKKYIGLPYISWSQIETFNDKIGFNTGLLGEYEYILKYFSKAEFPDLGWGVFGGETEDYITLRKSGENFSEKEKAVLDTVKPLGIFQEEICYYIEELNCIVLGYIDDYTKEENGIIKLLRDYKTKSESSKKDLHLPKKHQIELYVLGLRQRGLKVETAEYCVIERLGGKACMDGGGRQSLSIGERIWYEPYNWTEERLKETHQLVVATVKNISELYTCYQKYFK